MIHAHRRSRATHRRPATQSKLLVWPYWAYWASVLCTIAVLIGFGILRWHAQSHAGPGRRAAIERRQLTPPTAQGGTEIAHPLVYPYSVIPGGVHSAQQLRNAIAHDPLVAALYANFDLSRAHVIRLKRDRQVYVSYRFGDHIYWTKKRLLLRAGETVISDGKHEARTRCGNRISETPVEPVSQNEPTNAAVNDPMKAPPENPLVADNPGAPPVMPFDPVVPPPQNIAPPSGPPSPPPVSLIPPLSWPIVGGGPPSAPSILPPPPTPPVATPEPSAVWLLALGLIALATARLWRRRRVNEAPSQPFRK